MLLSESNKKRLQELAGVVSEKSGVPRTVSHTSRHNAKYRNPKGSAKYFDAYKKDENLEEITTNQIELPTDYIHDHFNENIWEGDELKAEVQEKLEDIAKDFHEYLKIDAPIKDIWLTGSLANYNWSEYSDIDLHVLIDYKEIDEDEDFVRDFLGSKKSVWNDTHDITMKGFEVELYAQDSDEFHRASGVYSIQDEEWVRKPSLEEPKIDRDSIKDKVKSIADKIEEVEGIEDPEKAYRKGNKLKDKIKKMRKAGLEKEGEFSSENLAFKYLRNNGYIERLFNAITDSYDKNMSITEIEEEKTATQEYNEKTNVVLADEVLSIVKSIHTNDDDFESGDLAERIYKFPFYELTEVPMSTLDTEEFSTNWEVVDDYVEKTKENPDYPPIVFDPEENSIIDGMHRVQALEELGYDTVRAYVGLRSSSKQEDMNINETFKKAIRKDLNEFFNSKGFHASIEDWLDKWKQKGIDVSDIDYGDGMDMGISKVDKLLSEDKIDEEFASKAQQRYFYAMADKPGKKGDKFEKMAKEFSKETDFDEIPDKVNEDEMFYKSPVQHKLYLENNINEEHGDNLDTIKDFILSCCRENDIDESTIVFLRGTRKGSALKTTASYNVGNHCVHIYCKGRHVVDIMRSIAHELMHMRQNLDGRLHDKSGDDGSEHENEAHAFAGLMIRKFGKEKPSIYENYNRNKKLI